MLSELANPSQRSGERLTVRVDKRIVFLDFAEIDWIEAGGHYVRIHAGSNTYFVRGKIGSFFGTSEDKRFVRIHRSIVVNIDRIKELHARTSRECIAVLKNGTKLPCSRTYATLRQLVVSIEPTRILLPKMPLCNATVLHPDLENSLSPTCFQHREI